MKRRHSSFLGLVMMGAILAACASAPKEKPRLPLPLPAGVPAAAVAINEEGIQAYEQARYDQARGLFEKAVGAAPNSGEAHYNLGLTLYALGARDEANAQFIEAANLAPGNKVIWDSPALRRYGSPEPTIKKKAAPAVPPRGMGGYGGIGGR